MVGVLHCRRPVIVESELGSGGVFKNMKLENMEMKSLHGPGLPVHSHSGGGLVQSASLRHSDPGFGFRDYCVDIADSAQ